MKLAQLLMVGLAAALVGCGADKGSQTSSSGSGGAIAAEGSQSKAQRAATIAKSIQADPGNADEVLRRNGMTEDQFEALMYEVAADPEMSKEYNARVSGSR